MRIRQPSNAPSLAIPRSPNVPQLAKREGKTNLASWHDACPLDLVLPRPRADFLLSRCENLGKLGWEIAMAISLAPTSERTSELGLGWELGWGSKIKMLVGQARTMYVVWFRPGQRED